MTSKDKVKFVALMAFFVAIAAGVIGGMTSGLDIAAASFVYSFRSDLLTQIMLAATFLGSTPFITVAAIIVFLALWTKRLKNEAILLAAMLITSVAIDNILKYLIRRERPDIAPLDTGITYSFPSGHAMNSLVFYGLLAYLAYRWIKNKRLLFTIDAAAIILVALIGFSRVYLGAHFPTDVLAGFIAGLIVLDGAIAIRANLVRIDL